MSIRFIIITREWQKTRYRSLLHANFLQCLSTRNPNVRPVKFYVPNNCMPQEKSMCVWFVSSHRHGTGCIQLGAPRNRVETQENYNQTKHASSIHTYDGWRLHVRYILFIFSFFRPLASALQSGLFVPSTLATESYRQDKRATRRRWWKNNEK